MSDKDNSLHDVAENMRREAQSLSVDAWWAISSEQVKAMPIQTPTEIQQADSNTKTLEWQNGAAYWQRKRW